MHIIRRFPALVALLLGAVAACGFAPLEAWPLTLACFAAWMWLVHDAPTGRQALWRGWAFGVGHFTINDNWFQHAFDFQDKMPPVLGYAAPVALALFLGLYPMMAAGLAWRMRGRSVDLAYVAAFAAAWIASEWLRSVLLSGYAWDPLSVIWIAVPDIARMASAIGTYALSGKPGPRPRLVLWPEGVVRDFLDDGYPLYIYDRRYPWVTRARIARVLGPNDRLLTGATPLRFDSRGEVAGASNAVQAIAPDGSLVGRYDKAHLVPFGEYLPMPWLLRPLGLARLVPGDFDFDAGPGPSAITLPGFGAIGVQTCYEIIFSGHVVEPGKRPRMLFNPSTDAWFGKWGPPQHLAQARMRAIEEGLPIVRATPTGISAVIAADGTLVATVPHETAGAIEVPMPAAGAPTLFSRFGNVMAGVVALILAAMAVALRRRAR